MIDQSSLRIIFTLLALQLTPPIMAVDNVGVKGKSEVVEALIQDDGIRGLIIDNTVTFIGRDFYDAFAMAWLDQNVRDSDNLSISERPTARSGSRIWIEYNRKRLFQVNLSPVRANIETTARKAAISVARRVEELQLTRLLYVNPDLAPDEF